IDKRTKRGECIDANKRLSCQKLGVRACRPVEHPCRYFKPPICLRPIQRAAKNDITNLVDRPMNANSATKPRMMLIKNLTKNGPVGVLKRCCTTTPDRTAPWATSLRLHTPNATLPGRNGAGRCAMPRAPRPTPLLHRAPWAHIQPGLFPLLDEARGSDHVLSFQAATGSSGAGD